MFNPKKNDLYDDIRQPPTPIDIKGYGIKDITAFLAIIER
jgi:hypothetical protein